MKVVTLDIDRNTTIVLETDTFARVLSAARYALYQFKKKEGATFPEIDNNALKMIADIEFKLSSFGKGGKRQ